MLDLQLLLGLHDFAALACWIEGHRADTDHLDRPRTAPCGIVMTDQSEDERFVMLDHMKPERRHQVIDQLRDMMAGYPWLVHEERAK